MAVIIGHDDAGNPIIKSIGGAGTTDDQERKKAFMLDSLIRENIKNIYKHIISKKILKKSGKSGKAEAYWMLGKTLRDIFYNSGLINSKEKHLFWHNVNLYLPEELSAKNRGPKRFHAEYCFRLARFTKEKALSLKWSEWSYLFDCSHDSRFDDWLKDIIKKDQTKITRNNVRLFSKIQNTILTKIETSDLNDDELLRIYNTAWELAKEVNKIIDKKNPKQQEIIKAIKNDIELICMLIGGEIQTDDFFDMLLNRNSIKL